METKVKSPSFLAFDLGAESGRGVVGSLEDEDLLRLQEVHRFTNGPIQVLDSLHWDILRIWSEIQQGLGIAARQYGDTLASLGLDAWGVDFGLLAADDTLLGNPYHYRDHRTDGMMEAAFGMVSREEIYQQTGIQFLQLNSLYQLLAMSRAGSPALAAARTFLNIPDLLNFWLTGRKVSEFTIATTTQCYDTRAGKWAAGMLERLSIPAHIFGEIVPPGTALGTVRPAIASEAGCKPLPVIAPATHDTGSAVAAVPSSSKDYIYLSSGTWSLMGVEIKEPIITQESLEAGLTNEGGVNGTFRFLKNIMGLWLVQQCRRQWEREGTNYSYDDLTHLAAEAPAFGPLVLPPDNRFLPLGNMPARICEFCRLSGQSVPQTHGEVVRCALESLAFEYRWVAERLDSLVGRHQPVIHIIGGGSRNRVLNQFAANATGRTVVAGPVEATAIGNLLMQAIALGYVASLDEGRAIVRRSFDVSTYDPVDGAAWDAAYARYLSLRQKYL